MKTPLLQDAANTPELLQQTLAEAIRYLAQVDDAKVTTPHAGQLLTSLDAQGLGAAGALHYFQDHYAQTLSASPGPRYFGLVTGGSTPAAMMGDWLTAAYDQNAAGLDGTSTPAIEHETVNLLRQLFDLPAEFSGAFVSGATMSNFVGLALARQWWGRQHGVNVAADGLIGLPKLTILSGAPHSSVFKALSMLGIGRNHIQLVPLMAQREAIDIEALRQALRDQHGTPCIVVGNAGTVNTVDFDDFGALAALKHEFNFWLHIDGAFGGFAAASPHYAYLLAGWQIADSIAIDLHKWLNVPYDSAVQFSRHLDLQIEVFQNAGAAYMGDIDRRNPPFVHLTPESSRRWRALPAWFTLMAYGKAGHSNIVEQCCAHAKALGERIAAEPRLKLLAPVRMNVACFTLANLENEAADFAANVSRYLAAVNAEGKAYFTPTVYKGVPAIRAAFSNWRTSAADVVMAWQSLLAHLPRS